MEVYLPRGYDDTPDWWKRLCKKTNGSPVPYLHKYDVIIHYYRGFKDDVEYVEFPSEKIYTLFLLQL
jgi:hypothetical protein